MGVVLAAWGQLVVTLEALASGVVLFVLLGMSNALAE
jgi:hypothetical protein